MVGRVAADPQNNPAVEGDWTDHHLRPTLAGLKKKARASFPARALTLMKNKLY